MAIINFPVKMAKNIEEESINEESADNTLKLFPLPASQKRLYGIEGLWSCVLFDTEEELYKWSEKHELEEGVEITLDYVGDFAGYTDVLVVTYDEGKDIISSENEEEYSIFDPYDSAEMHTPIWLTYHVTDVVKDMYSALIKSGTTLKDDTYGKKRPKLTLVIGNKDQSKD